MPGDFFFFGETMSLARQSLFAPMFARLFGLMAFVLPMGCGESLPPPDLPTWSDAATNGDSDADHTLEPPSGDDDAGLPGLPDSGVSADDDDAGPQDGADAALDIESDAGPDAEPDAGDPPEDEEDLRPVLYPDGWLRSPISPSVVASMRAIAAQNAASDPETFIKVGDSHTVNTNFMRCFDSDSALDLDGRAYLSDAIAAFRAGNSAPFSRTSLAAKVGMSASWAMTADSTGIAPVDQEVAALNPRFALVSYGTNDMQSWGEGPLLHQNAVWNFHANMTALLDHLIEQGIVPIVTGLLPRGDSAKFPDAPLWVPAYNALTRGMAEARQIPWFDMFSATKDIPGQALASDGLHGNSSTRPCDFTAAHLTYNYNLRNLNNMELLSDAWRTVVLGERAPDTEDLPFLSGSGAPTDPFQIPSLPFTHHANTADSPHSVIASYPVCSSADESGAEFYYRLTLPQATNVRFMVFSENKSDIDLHVLTGQSGAPGCLARNDKIIQRRFEAGTYDIVLDSFEGLVGPYQLVVVECEEGDETCE